ncbi:MAG: MltA domain-containing protein [Thermodesulfobacteriota bacterium]|nr:MltA domain-containing protein [Thermodesulfobacteriota bacterium]
MQRILWSVVMSLLLLHLPGCAVSPLIPVSSRSIPPFLDDLGRQGLNQAVQHSLDYLRSRPADATVVTIADQEIPVSRLAQSLVAFQDLLAAKLSDQELQEKISQQFDVFQAAGTKGFNPGRKMLVTGYYQPVLDGSLRKKTPYLYPLYTIPPDLVIKPSKNSTRKRIGRMEGENFTSYWTREDIETLGKAAGSELAWLKDPLDVFFLQVQGSGLIRLRDGSLRGIHYAAKNGHPYRSIGKFMVQTGRISLEKASMETIRTYINTHPQERQEILYTNPSYIFFNWTRTHGAIGNLDRELTPGRSIAADQSCFPAGGLAFLKTRQPVIRSGKIVDWKPVHRFVLVQDTGSAIRGPGRVDLFEGAGDQAGRVAGSMKETGTLYFLLSRSDKS